MARKKWMNDYEIVNYFGKHAENLAGTTSKYFIGSTGTKYERGQLWNIVRKQGRA